MLRRLGRGWARACSSRAAGRRHALVLAAIVVVGAVVRLAYWGEPMRYDEGFSFLNYAMLPVRAITLTYTTPNNQILNTLFMHVEWRLFGTSIYALRLHVLLAGIVSPLLAYWVARELYDATAGLFAAALIATSSPLVDFSVNARGYELGVVFVLLFLGLGVRLLRTGDRWAGRFLVLSAGLAIWSVPTMAYALAAVALWMLASVLIDRPLDRARLLQVLGTLALAGALGYVVCWPLIGQPGWNFIPSLPHTWNAVHPLITATWQLWNRTTFHPFDWLIAAAFLASLFLPRNLARERMPLPLAVLVVVLAVLLAGPVSPFARSYIGLLPLYLISASGALSAAGSLAARRVKSTSPVLAGVAAVVLALVLGISVLHGGQAHSEEPPASDNNIVSILERTPKPGGQVLIDEPAYGAGVGFYLARAGKQELVTGHVTPAQRAAGQVLVIVPTGPGGYAAGARSTVTNFGGHPLPRQTPRLVKRMTYISLYDVAVSHS